MDRSTYDDDIYAWSREQGAALRRLAETRRDLPNDLDLENIAEEIETVGRNEVRTVESFVELMLRHVLKLASAPEARSARHWRGEIDIQARSARSEFRNSMRQTIGLDDAWRAAVTRADADLDQHGDTILPDLPATCPFTLDALLKTPFDVEAAVTRLRSLDRETPRD